MSITVRRVEPSDYESIWRIFVDESAFGGTLQMPYPAKETWRERLSKVDHTNYLLVACEGDQVVGQAGLHGVSTHPRRAHSATLGMAVPRVWQGKGVGTALMTALVDLADNWFGYSRLELTVYVDNTRAQSLYRKFGFEVEGTFRAYALRAGTFVDAHAMARLHERPSLTGGV
jgi:L-phenylalanine/L-methionine N-acetyltransferase